MKNMKNGYMIKNKKGISPLIATILLVVVAVVLIAIVLGWGKDFTRSSLESANTNNFMNFTDSDKGMFVKIEDGINGRYFATYTPPSYLDDKPITITHYSLFSTDPIPLEPNVSLKPNTKNALDLGIVDSSFDLKLYTDSNTVISKTGLKNFDRKTTGDCPEGFSFVPGNFLYDTINGSFGGFCIAKWEMKVDTNGDGVGNLSTDIAGCDYGDDAWYHLKEDNQDCNVLNYDIVSSAYGHPINYINLLDFRDACESLGGHVMTMDERMTVLRNLERVPENWTSGEVGVGSLYTGNTGSCSVSSACYSSSNDPDSGVSRDPSARLYLTNGEEIWDFSGNLYEWVDYTFNGYLPYSSSQDSWEWIEYSEGGDSSFPILDNYGSLDYKNFRSINPSYSSSQGIGRLYTEEEYDTTNKVPLSGGSWSTGTSAGPFSLHLTQPSGYWNNSHFGGRCVVVN